MLPHGLFAKASPSPLAPSSREREQSHSGGEAGWGGGVFARGGGGSPCYPLCFLDCDVRG